MPCEPALRPRAWQRISCHSKAAQSCGALYDTTSNYWHFGARWNNAYTSNFTTQDTSSYLSNPQNGNRYAYASDNPANYIDPTGLQGQSTCSEVNSLSECSVPSYASTGTSPDWNMLYHIGSVIVKAGLALRSVATYTIDPWPVILYYPRVCSACAGVPPIEPPSA
jgi:RHS repeat-associated protein